ncbi:MAG: hypothetical protein H6732_10680 [Alphaproteobacteria bacterium]|nr:hypothetical protein [Alphaproteobacteria bacterium]
MSEATNVRAIHDQLATLLEERVTELMTEIKTSQALTRQIARTEEEIERQQLLKDKLEAELGPLRTRAAELASETEELRTQLDDAGDLVARLGEIREELEALQAGGQGA